MKHSWATDWSGTLLRIPAISFSHFTIILYVLQTNVSLLLLLWASMFSRSAAVWSTEYFSVSIYEEVMCTGLRWNKRAMQKKITSIGIRVCDDTWCVSTVSVSVDSCGWFYYLES